MTDKGIKQTNRENCYFCGSEGPIQTHHIVPKRYGGDESGDNLVDLCPTCHERIERLYDSRFYEELAINANKKEIEETSDFEADVLPVGNSKQQRKRLKWIKETIERLADQSSSGFASKKQVVDDLHANGGYSMDMIAHELDKLHQLGEIYSNCDGGIATT